MPLEQPDLLQDAPHLDRMETVAEETPCSASGRSCWALWWM